MEQEPLVDQEDKQPQPVFSISDQEVLEAKERIDQMHPLFTTPIEQVLPGGLGRCIRLMTGCCFKKIDNQQELRRQQIKKDKQAAYRKLVTLIFKLIYI